MDFEKHTLSDFERTTNQKEEDAADREERELAGVFGRVSVLITNRKKKA